MAKNYWNSETLTANRAFTGAGDGRWVERSGSNAIAVNPNRFHSASVYRNLCGGEPFEPSCSYCFDFWIDQDDSIRSGYSSNNGLSINYTDGTRTTCGLSHAASASIQGWVHQKVVTPANKTISTVTEIYSRGYNVYYRWDSSITKVEDIEYSKKGTVFSGQIKETAEAVKPTKGGLVFEQNLVEY